MQSSKRLKFIMKRDMLRSEDMINKSHEFWIFSVKLIYYYSVKVKYYQEGLSEF